MSKLGTISTPGQLPSASTRQNKTIKSYHQQGHAQFKPLKLSSTSKHLSIQSPPFHEASYASRKGRTIHTHNPKGDQALGLHVCTLPPPLLTPFIFTNQHHNVPSLCQLKSCSKLRPCFPTNGFNERNRTEACTSASR